MARVDHQSADWDLQLARIQNEYEAEQVKAASETRDRRGRR